MHNGKWTVEASMGACAALLENSAEITEAVLADAETRSLARAEADSTRRGRKVRPAIIREDVEQALGAARELKARLDRLWAESRDKDARNILAYCQGTFEALGKYNTATALAWAEALEGGLRHA